ncbi:MAG: 50S ribosomal protein L20 [Balneola sp.]|nr:50S ribosomal protein L20 [Balneola sp.]|tara:strand:- start:16824 stop:17171 length:348 start_codon:yes stop_codon:yes gene_type:complete
MPRSLNLVASRRRRKKIMKQAKGYWGKRKNVYTIAKNAVEKGLQYQYRDRKNRKRVFRKLWIARINAGARLNGSTYSKLIHAMSQKSMVINRKVLADLAIHDPETFTAIVTEAHS